MELQTTSVLSLFETNKAERQSFVADVVQRLISGEVDPLKLHLQVKCTEQILSDLKEQPEYKEMLLETAEQYGKKFERYNSEFAIKEAGTNWHYDKCEDVEYNKMVEDMEALKDRMKQREKFLQSIPVSGIADPENGNMIYPAYKTSTTIVQVTLK